MNSLLAGHDAEIFTHLLENRLVLNEVEGKELLFFDEAVLTEAIPQPVQSISADKLNTKNPEFITYTTNELQIVLLGGVNLQQFDRLRATIKINRRGSNNPLNSIRHTLDLYHSDYLEKFIIKASKGNLKNINLKVEWPIFLAGTTAREKLYEDNANRSLLIYLDSSKQHKEQIMNYQRKLSAGKIATKEEPQLIEFFKDMQTILRPIKVRNPYAEYLVIPEHVFKPLRTNSHYLAFIETVTFYYQYQKEIKTGPSTGEVILKPHWKTLNGQTNC